MELSEVEKEEFGFGYPKIDRAKRPAGWERGNFWSGLERVSTGVALMADWEFAFGCTVDLIKPFLASTGRTAEMIPCPAHPPCPCQHTVGPTRRHLLAASCNCEDWECETYVIEQRDILFYGLKWETFGDAVRRALGFGEPERTRLPGGWIYDLGVYEAIGAPVYLTFENREGLLGNLPPLMTLRQRPFILLTPTGQGCDESMEQSLRAQGAAHFALSPLVEVLPGGVLRTKGTIEPWLEEFKKQAASLQANGRVLSNIHQEIARVGQEAVELRTAKQRLEKMVADGMFAFTQKVDATSFKVLCTILAEGNVYKAGQALGMADTTMRELLKDWESRGGPYLAMLDLVRWRKKVGRRETVPINDNVLLGKARPVDYPGLLSDVLDGLLSMTDRNWEELSKELAELLRTVPES